MQNILPVFQISASFSSPVQSLTQLSIPDPATFTFPTIVSYFPLQSESFFPIFTPLYLPVFFLSSLLIFLSVFCFEPKNFLPNSVCFRRGVLGAYSPLKTSFKHLKAAERKKWFHFCRPVFNKACFAAK